MKLKRLIGLYDDSTKNYLENKFNEKKIRYIIQSDYEGPSGGICYVHEDDFEESLEILNNSTIEFADLNSETLPILKKILKFTKRVPIVGNMTINSRISILISIFLFIIISVILLNFEKVSKNELINNQWCINHIKLNNGLEIELPNTKPALMIEGGCVNKLNFEENTFDLSSITSGTWKYINANKVEIKDNSNKYSGIYDIKRKLANDVLQLKSEKLTIKLKRNILSSNKIIFNIERD